MRIRKAREEEFLDIHDFVEDCEPLECYPEHLYKIMMRYFGNQSFVAEEDKEMVGFVMGFVSNTDKKTYFLWQIGIRPDAQGKGLGRKLLKKVEERVRKMGVKRIELTIDPKNSASRRLFEKTGYKNISEKEGPIVTVKGNSCIKDYYEPGRHFMLYEKRL